MNGKLIVSEHGRDRVHELCDDLVVIGSGEGVQLVLHDPAAAALHCEIRRLPQGFKVVDLESPTGITVNGKTVNQALLRHGDTLRIGDTKITYLGSSAPAEKKPRRDPTPLRELPVGDDGQPKRFYRHEAMQRRGLPPAAKAGIAITALVFGGLLILQFSKAEYGDPGLPDFRRAQELRAKGDEPSLSTARDLLKPLLGKEYGGVKVIDALDEVESKLAVIANERGASEQKTFVDETLARFRDHPDDAGWLRQRAKTFRERWPGSIRLAEIEALIPTAELGGAEPEKVWLAALAEIRAALASAQFKQANARLDTLAADPEFGPRLKDRIADTRKTVTAEFRRHFERRCDAALDAKARGDTDHARRIYAELVDAGIEPFATEAKGFLDALR